MSDKFFYSATLALGLMLGVLLAWGYTKGFLQ